MTARPLPRTPYPRLRRAVLAALAAGPGIGAEVFARVARRDLRAPAFVHVMRELYALERGGLARARPNRRDPVPLRRPCRRFALTRAGRRRLARASRSPR